MAKFTIEQFTNPDVEIEAASYNLNEGFFWFVNSQGFDVFTIKANDVYSIKREAA